MLDAIANTFVYPDRLQKFGVKLVYATDRLAGESQLQTGHKQVHPMDNRAPGRRAARVFGVQMHGIEISGYSGKPHLVFGRKRPRSDVRSNGHSKSRYTCVSWIGSSNRRRWR